MRAWKLEQFMALGWSIRRRKSHCLEYIYSFTSLQRFLYNCSCGRVPMGLTARSMGVHERRIVVYFALHNAVQAHAFGYGKTVIERWSVAWTTAATY